jgi:peroxiredoxin Q/BCP
MIELGKKAPAFAAKDQNGHTRTLSEFKGKNLVLFFYPKDDTPGCTIEACSFRDRSAAIKKAGANIIGISIDEEKSHQKFISKYHLPFPLLADTDKKIVNTYGVWGEKSFMGRKYLGTNRVTIIIDDKGIVCKVFEKVTPTGHADEVLAAIKVM